MHAVFCYGSNLNLDHLGDWLGRKGISLPRRTSLIRMLSGSGQPAYLRDHRLAWNCFAATWGGGVANVTPAEGASVAGVVFRNVATELLRLLDEKEGHPSFYRRHKRQVHLLDNPRAIEAWVYSAVPNEKQEILPTEAYLRIIQDGALFWKLPHDHIRELAAIQYAR